jgi:hypothetical protein
MTKVDICNLALSKVGSEGGLISSITEDSKEAVLCNQFYNQTLGEVLSLGAWNCAKARVELTPNEWDEDKADYAEDDKVRHKGTFYKCTTDNTTKEPGVDDDWKDDWDELTPTFGWSYEYDLPNDTHRPLSYFASKTSRDQSAEWTIEGGKVLSNSGTGYLLYIKTIAEADMPAIFISVLVQALAIRLCFPLMQDKNIERALIQEMQELVLPEARRLNAFEGYRRPVIHSDWLDATVSYGEGFRALDVAPEPFVFS